MLKPSIDHEALADLREFHSDVVRLITSLTEAARDLDESIKEGSDYTGKQRRRAIVFSALDAMWQADERDFREVVRSVGYVPQSRAAAVIDSAMGS